MNEQQIADLAAALGFDIPAERLADVAAALQGQIAGRGGLAAEGLEGVEPAVSFDARWGDRP